ncbi:hypothetical protein HZA99_03200 [Candidatus Woesearchaeota archaeon]|nr:hypothetical protein [Candidatus Woesearchaeota archaeon]
MKKQFICVLALLSAAILLSSCTPQGASSAPENAGDQIVCTADVQECSDGSFVGRDVNNNCEFKECP